MLVVNVSRFHIFLFFQVLANRREAVTTKTSEIEGHVNVFGQGPASTCPTGLARLEAELTSLKSEASEIEEACVALDKELENLSNHVVDLMGDGPSSPLGSMLTPSQLQSLRGSMRRSSSSGDDSSDDDDEEEGRHYFPTICTIIPAGECAGVQRLAASIEIFLGAMNTAERAAQEEQARIVRESESSEVADAPSLFGSIIGTLVSAYCRGHTCALASVSVRDKLDVASCVLCVVAESCR